MFGEEKNIEVAEPFFHEILGASADDDHTVLGVFRQEV
jgi:hypothetical protein